MDYADGHAPMGMRWMMDAMQGKPKPTNTSPGMIYMLCGATQRSNTNPADKTSPAIPIGPRSHSGEIVGTAFSIPHRIRVKVIAPQRDAAAYDRLVPSSRIHEYRMDATPEDILSISTAASDPELAEAKKRAALLYHPDKFPSATDELKHILTRRMQEVSEAFEEIRTKRRR
jgi:hypothetical protein